MRGPAGTSVRANELPQMRIYYFCGLTGRKPDNASKPRAVCALGRALQALGSAEVVPVRWSLEQGAIVRAEPSFLTALVDGEGAVFAPEPCPGAPIDIDIAATREEASWLLIPAMPTPRNGDAGYPPSDILTSLAYARRVGMRSALVFDDILPPTRPDIDSAEASGPVKFAAYSQALINADLILPASASTGALLSDGLREAGHPAQSWPRFAPIEIPQEIFGQPRCRPDPAEWWADGKIELVSFGTISTRENQLATLEAFNRVLRRKPHLPLALHLLGHTDPELVSSVTRQIRQSGGRARTHGCLSEEKRFPPIAAAHATILLSLTEDQSSAIGESLWLGTPCLCSNIGPTAEFARGGGCLTVNPTSIDAIASGIEQLATDEHSYRRLLAGLAARDLRTWRDYAAAMLDELRADRRGGHAPPPSSARAARPAPRDSNASTAALPSPSESIMNDEPAAPYEHRFTIGAGDLRCHDAYTAMRRGDSIEFDARTHGQVAESVLFFGPYITVEPGVYLLSFNGELDGELQIRFTHQGGTRVVKELLVNRFDRLLCLPLTSRLDRFEVVGLRTAALRSMKLQSISVHHIDPTRMSIDPG
jgi:glycosyltransferase involved in cell wall biosynthesis